jgi:hypothetical protein
MMEKGQIKKVESIKIKVSKKQSMFLFAFSQTYLENSKAIR